MVSCVSLLASNTLRSMALIRLHWINALNFIMIYSEGGESQLLQHMLMKEVWLAETCPLAMSFCCSLSLAPVNSQRSE